jgi:hypothetical protein
MQCVIDESEDCMKKNLEWLHHKKSIQRMHSPPICCNRLLPKRFIRNENEYKKKMKNILSFSNGFFLQLLYFERACEESAKCNQTIDHQLQLDRVACSECN